MNRANYALGVSAALFIVWMQRNKRWGLVVKAMDGTYKVRPSS
ncbi:MAG TPA: hypothetical protein VGF75_06275 [Candidatus Saccharimonadales bacterium]|jgi:hypothetical protein